jgi:hypothetical protein
MKNKMILLHEESVKKALFKLAETKTMEGREGILEMGYDDILNLVRPDINNLQTISVAMSTLQQEGLIKRLRRGTYGHPAQWDCSKLFENVEAKIPVMAIAENVAKPDEQITMTIIGEKNPEPNAPIEFEVEVSTAEIKANIKEMIDFMKKLPTEMAGHLQVLTKQLKFEDENEVDTLKRQVEKLQEQITDTNKVLASERKEKQDVIFKLEVKEKEDRLHVNHNSASIIRTKNHILDELQRFVAAPPWQQKNRSAHTINDITEKLDTILKEAGVEV